MSSSSSGSFTSGLSRSTSSIPRCTRSDLISSARFRMFSERLDMVTLRRVKFSFVVFSCEVRSSSLVKGAGLFAFFCGGPSEDKSITSGVLDLTPAVCCRFNLRFSAFLAVLQKEQAIPFWRHVLHAFVLLIVLPFADQHSKKRKCAKIAYSVCGTQGLLALAHASHTLSILATPDGSPRASCSPGASGSWAVGSRVGSRGAGVIRAEGLGEATKVWVGEACLGGVGGGMDGVVIGSGEGFLSRREDSDLASGCLPSSSSSSSRSSFRAASPESCCCFSSASWG